MERLLKIGFRKVGTWCNTPAGLDYTLDTHTPHPNTLYAFTVEGVPHYVGKTTQTLRGRIYGYKNPAATQLTNLRVNASIRVALAEGLTVEIFVLPDEGLHSIGAFHLNLAAGLEDSIIRTLNPPWNGGKKHSLEEDSEVSPEEPPAPAYSFPLVMQRSYWHGGFFNPGTAHGVHFGGDGQPIELLCGDAAEPFLGHINRTANANGAPRIFGGGAFRAWVQANVPEMGTLRVDVLSPTSVRLIPEPT